MQRDVSRSAAALVFRSPGWSGFDPDRISGLIRAVGSPVLPGMEAAALDLARDLLEGVRADGDGAVAASRWRLSPWSEAEGFVHGADMVPALWRLYVAGPPTASGCGDRWA